MDQAPREALRWDPSSPSGGPGVSWLVATSLLSLTPAAPPHVNSGDTVQFITFEIRTTPSGALLVPLRRDTFSICRPPGWGRAPPPWDMRSEVQCVWGRGGSAAGPGVCVTICVGSGGRMAESGLWVLVAEWGEQIHRPGGREDSSLLVGLRDRGQHPCWEPRGWAGGP